MDIRNNVDQQPSSNGQSQPSSQSQSAQQMHFVPRETAEHQVIDQQRDATLAPQRQPAANPDRYRNARLGFEAFLIALCGYLIGVAGLPPLFDAPGSSGQSEIVTSGETSPDTLASDALASDVVASPVVDEATSANLTPGSGVSVTSARATWSTGYFQAALAKELMEELGYEVSEPSLNEVAPADVYGMMADGSIDFWTNSWMPNHSTFLEEESGAGTSVGSQVTVVGGLLPAGGLEGIVVTKSVADENAIGSLGEINDNPDLVALFDEDGNGKADVYGCPDDWTCDDILDEVINLNGWSNLEQIETDYDEMVDASVAAVESGAPRLQYTWSPSGYLTRLRPGDNVSWLSIGERENMPDGSITPEFDFNDGDPAAVGSACTGDPCWLGWPAADIQVSAGNDFLDANPSARVLFEQMQLNVLDVALANVKYDTGENSEEDLARHAQEWIADNRQTVDAWLAAARAVDG